MDMETVFRAAGGEGAKIKICQSKNSPKDSLCGEAGIYSPPSPWDNAQAGNRREHIGSQSVTPYV